jgi:hypothetical protein
MSAAKGCGPAKRPAINWCNVAKGAELAITMEFPVKTCVRAGVNNQYK